MNKIEKNILKKLNQALDVNYKNLTEFDSRSWTALIYVLCWNATKNINLDKKELDYLIRHSKLNFQPHANGSTPAMYALALNKDQELSFSEEQLTYIIRQSDLTIIDNAGYNLLMYYLQYKKNEGLEIIKESEINYLIKESNLEQTTGRGSDMVNALIIATKANDEINAIKIIKEMIIRGNEIKNECYRNSKLEYQDKINRLIEIVETELKIKNLFKEKFINGVLSKI